MRARVMRIFEDWKQHQAVILDHRMAQDRLEREMQRTLEAGQKKQTKLKKAEVVSEIPMVTLSSEEKERVEVLQRALAGEKDIPLKFDNSVTVEQQLRVKKNDRPLPIVPPIITHGQQRTIPQVLVSKVLDIINDAPHIVWKAGMVSETLPGIFPVSVVSEVLEKLTAEHFIFCIGHGRYRAITEVEESREVN